MIQRRQTIWLLLATVAALMCFLYPFATGKGIKNALETDRMVRADSNFLLLICTGASMLFSAAIIFLYKDRKLQMKLSVAGLLLAVIILLLYIMEMNKLTKSVLALSSVLPIIILAGYFLAFRDIRKDEKLVRSLDKLR
jgi:O-antigen/teichoic acid export membrane protein